MMGDKMIPTQMTMIPVDEPGESTAIQWKKIQFDLTISDDFFLYASYSNKEWEKEYENNKS